MYAIRSYYDRHNDEVSMMNTEFIDPRSETTRQRLIDTGLELFGRYGLDGVTTRQLAT